MMKLPAYLAFVGLLSFNASLSFADNKIQNLLNKDISKYNIPGATLSIKYPKTPLMTYSTGLGNIEKKTPMTDSQLVYIGSVTKSFIGVLVLELQEQGRLKLSDELNKLATTDSQLHKILLRYPTLGTITLEQLLTHNSGLPDVFNTKMFSDVFKDNPKKLWSDSELLALAMKQKAWFKPGEKNKYYYSNTDYILVGMAIESISGKTVKSLLEKLFQQAKLRDIYYPPITENIANKIAHGYIDDRMNWPGMAIFRNYPPVMVPGVKAVKAYDVSSLASILDPQSPASGGIVTNTKAMASWYDALFNHEIISRQSLAMMLKGNPTGYGYDYGLGITIRYSARYNSAIISHNGSQLGYQTNLIYLKDKNIIIAIAINSDSDAISAPEKPMLVELISEILKQQPKQ